MQTVYIETTIPSYLAAHPSRQEPMATHQKLTHEWWKNERHKFLLYSSLLVRQEASRGDANAVRRRLPYLTDIAELDVLIGTDKLEADLIRLFQLPPQMQAICPWRFCTGWTTCSPGTAPTLRTRLCRRISWSIVTITSCMSPSFAHPKHSAPQPHD